MIPDSRIRKVVCNYPPSWRIAMTHRNPSVEVAGGEPANFVATATRAFSGSEIR
jgi:hypothetical protein